MRAHGKGKSASDVAKRRVPTQARSLRRYEAILTAAAEAFADHGFDATTMEGIAARADTSIGSLYQFFPNKLAVFRELAQRGLALSRETFAKLLGPNPAARPWRELVDVMVDGYRELQQHPTMRAIFGNIQLYGEYAEDDAVLLRDMTTTVATLCGVWAPHLEVDRRTVIAQLIVNTVATAELLIARENERGDDLVAETKKLVIRYLEPYVELPSKSKAKASVKSKAKSRSKSRAKPRR